MGYPARTQELSNLRISSSPDSISLATRKHTRLPYEKPLNVAQIPGLNTLGISLVRIDYTPGGLNPLHTHPHATEILTVLDGSLTVGFVTSNAGNHLFLKVLNKDYIFMFPKGLVNFQFNSGWKNAVAVAALSSQNPGVITIGNTIFGSKSPISDFVLTKAFQTDVGPLIGSSVFAP